jgi:protein-disulfide isomerase
VKIVEFGDYKCPGCKAWSQYVYPEVKKRWIDKGVASLTFIHTNFHGEESRFGSTAAEALWEMNPDAFWPYMKTIYDRQPGEASHNTVWITEEVVTELARKVAPDLNVDQWRTLRASDKIRARVQTDDELVRTFQVQKTPTIIINGTVLEDPFDLEMMQTLIDQYKE